MKLAKLTVVRDGSKSYVWFRSRRIWVSVEPNRLVYNNPARGRIIRSGNDFTCVQDCNFWHALVESNGTPPLAVAGACKVFELGDGSLIINSTSSFVELMTLDGDILKIERGSNDANP